MMAAVVPAATNEKGRSRELFIIIFKNGNFLFCFFVCGSVCCGIELNNLLPAVADLAVVLPPGCVLVPETCVKGGGGYIEKEENKIIRKENVFFFFRTYR